MRYTDLDVERVAEAIKRAAVDADGTYPMGTGRFYAAQARAALEAMEREPDHFYIATFDDVNISQTTDTEPVMMRRYTILAGPWDTPIDAWDGGWMNDEQWNSAVVLGFKGTRAIYAYHELMSDVPTEDALDATSAEDSLFSRGAAAKGGE